MLLSFSGCSIFELHIGHRTSTEIPFDDGGNLEKVFECAGNIVTNLHTEKDAWWSDKITVKDLELGILETGNFSKNNIAGIRVKLLHNRVRNTLVVDLKATGPYCIDLGVNAAMDDFISKMLVCLST